MTPLPPELDALMPKPVAFARRWHADGEKPVKVAGKWPGKFKLHAVSERQCLADDEPLFTADQVRQAILDATERAAKKVESFPRWLGENRREIAAAIRGGGQG